MQFAMLAWSTVQQNHPAAMSNLASMYSLGAGVVQDQEAAVELFTRAAELGYAEAQFNLGWIESEGLAGSNQRGRLFLGMRRRP